MTELYDDAVRVECPETGLLLRPLVEVRMLQPGDEVTHNGLTYRILHGCPDGDADCQFFHAERVLLSDESG